MKIIFIIILIILYLCSIEGSQGDMVSILAEDGISLKGLYYDKSNGDAPSLLLFHMLGRNSQDWLNFIPELNRYFSILAIDFRGHGKSRQQDGFLLDYRDFDEEKWVNLKRDVEAAYNYLRSKNLNKELSIGIIGASLGANLAMFLASQHDDIKAVVLLSPGLNYNGIEILPYLKFFKGKVLIIASEKDEYSYKSSLQIFNKYNKRIVLKIYPGAFHGTRILKNYPESIDFIITWLRTQF